MGLLTCGLGGLCEDGTVIESPQLNNTEKVLNTKLSNLTETYKDEGNTTKARYPRRIDDFSSSITEPIIRAVKTTISFLERPFQKKICPSKMSQNLRANPPPP